MLFFDSIENNPNCVVATKLNIKNFIIWFNMILTVPKLCILNVGTVPTFSSCHFNIHYLIKHCTIVAIIMLGLVAYPPSDYYWSWDGNPKPNWTLLWVDLWESQTKNAKVLIAIFRFCMNLEFCNLYLFECKMIWLMINGIFHYIFIIF